MIKFRSLLLIFLFASGCRNRITHSHDDGPVIILVAGQSNAYAAAITDADKAYSVTGRVTISDSFTPGITPTPATLLNWSLTWLKLGDIIAAERNRDVHIINIAIGSTDSNQWAGMYKARLINAIQTSKPDFIIWVQGEQDTYQNFPEDQTYQNYKAILEGVSVPFYCALDGFMPGLDREPVRAAQTRIINEGLARRGIDFDLIRSNPANVEQWGIHIAGPGFDAHARAWYDLLVSERML